MDSTMTAPHVTDAQCDLWAYLWNDGPCPTQSEMDELREQEARDIAEVERRADAEMAALHPCGEANCPLWK